MSLLSISVRTVTVVLLCTHQSQAGFSKISGYVPVSDVSGSLAIGTAIESVDRALSAQPADWPSAIAEYEKKIHSNVSLRSITHLPLASRSDIFNAFSLYYNSNDYTHDFVIAALKGEGAFALNDKARTELTMKGIVLQGVLMASISHLHEAYRLCKLGQTSNEHGAPHFVDHAWAIYACSESTGPIRLAEKRAPQFDVEVVHKTEAGGSRVNNRLLEMFSLLQTQARFGNCSAVWHISRRIIPTMQVPIIQGMLREAFEVDPRQYGEHKGADGFIEVVEGWAFTRAVLPAISNCSVDAATVIKRNMDTIAAGPPGPHMQDGFVAVKKAVESTYVCLGISCAEVNAMIRPYKTGQLLWSPCNDSELQAQSAPRSDATSVAHHAVVISWALLHIVVTLGLYVQM